ncbi:uncharacterized protein (TIGR02677 family) [Actinopolyspora biskrensis]|uniref:Uncharacterized protein (TIGR02677 family) n=1 Tax=Actinopolyspora biskrensis TaxID=1470178 RepID=A0A852Z063_9ACTN|nr:uncharacterized protein (TIGR02677 family) [Actinopolyspora biskrensis]
MTVDREAVEPRTETVTDTPHPDELSVTQRNSAGHSAPEDESPETPLPVGERVAPEAGEDELVSDDRSDERRLLLYRHLQVSGHRTYLTIMRLFTSTLLADLSASEVSGALAVAEREGRIAAGESELPTVVERLRKLREWGNLTFGRRETVASSISEFQHGSARFQVSKLGVRVQRDVDALLRVPEGAREVSRELLPAVERGLQEIVELLPTALSAEAAPEGARERLAEQVTTVFLQHSELAATVRDFYAYLGQVVTRHQLDPKEISGFRNLLVEYIQAVVEDVIRYTEPVAASLRTLAARREELLAALGTEEELGAEVERARGRTAADWQELTEWFLDSPGRPSQVSALREATARAIGSLLASVKHATSGGGPVPGHRGDLLKLARWFDRSTPDEAHELHAAAFGLYSARCVQPAPEHDADEHTTSWRDGRRTTIPVNVRNRSDRSARGGTSRVLHDPMTEQQLLDEERANQQRRAAAAAELAASRAEPDELRVSSDALEMLCELLSLAMAGRDSPEEAGTATEPVHGLRLIVRHDSARTTRVTGTTGDLVLEDTVVELDVTAGHEHPAERGGTSDRISGAAR